MSNIEQSSRYIFEHIPKTGGTSLRRFFTDVFPRHSVYFYYRGGIFSATDVVSPVFRFPFLAVVKTRLTNSEFGKKLFHLIKRTIPQQRLHKKIQEPWSVIVGHKAAVRFHKDYPEANLLTVLRSPLERAVSHYFYVRQSADVDRVKPEWAIGTEMNLGLEEFLLDEATRNFQSEHLEGLKLSDFSVVGVTESLDLFCREFDLQREVNLPRLNATAKPNFLLPPKLIDQFTQLNEHDIDLYHGARKRAGLD